MQFNKFLSFAIVTSLLNLSACSTSSTGRSQIMLVSPDQLNQMGASSFEEMKKKEKISADQKLTAYVQCVADAIIPFVPESAHKGTWELVLFDSEQVNAFALPGGKIGVYTAILNVAETPDQLAAIIGHEIGHVIEGHSNERLSSGQLSQAGLAIAGAVMDSQDLQYKNELMAGLGLGVQYGVILPYGRAHEKEADIVGQNLMAQAGFDPIASIELWQNMAKIGGQQPAEFMSTHPAHDTRINKLTDNLVYSQPFYLAVSKKPSCVKPLNK
ncbi:MAG: M48 family metallopeptidase [Thalassotalea sp.]